MAGSNFSILDSSDNTTKTPISTPSNDVNGNTVVAHLVMIAVSGIAVPIDSLRPLPVIAIVPAQTTQLGNSTSATASNFDTAIPAPSSGSIRKGGSVWNISAQTLSIFFGPAANATPAASIPLSPGDSISCTLQSGVVLQDQVSIACASAASQPYVVTF